MPFDAVVFDYGNTLARFDREQVHAFDRALAARMADRFGPVEFDALRAVRDQDRLASYLGDPPPHRENDMVAITRSMLETLYDRGFSDDEVGEVVAIRREEFVRIIASSDETRRVVDDLHARYRLALLSNYPDGASIRESLAVEGLADAFEVVVVSGDVGFVKPHPKPFETVLEALDLEPGRAVYVGDNWRADVQGAKRAGMAAVHLTTWQAPENLPREAGDVEPDLVLGSLADLPTALESL